MKSKSFASIKTLSEPTIKTGNHLFDEWFSRDGGIVSGTKIFVTGNSGAGKTTLMINIMNWLKNIKSSFYSREMSVSAIKHQVSGLQFDHDNAFFVDDAQCPRLEDYLMELEELKPQIVIVDSLQAIAQQDYPEIGEEKASVMVRLKIEKWCNDNAAILFLIGHNTKENEFAGKNTNMQMLDAHMVLEYDKKSNVRTIYWGKKNRKGPMGSLNYRIVDGNIEFYKNGEGVCFSDEFASFISGYLKNFDDDPERVKQAKLELNQTSDRLYKINKDHYNGYVSQFISSAYKILRKYNMG